MTRAHGGAFDVAFSILCLVALAFWLAMGSGQTFMIDEWEFIMNADDWSFDELMRPLNGHWSLGLKILWNSLMATVGMTSYMPYLLVANVLHVAAACGIYAYARRQTVPLIAIVAATVFLFLGSGYIDFVLGLQMNFNLAAAAGAWALVIVLREPRPRRALLAALLLVVAVATNGVGLPFVAATGAVIVLSRARWRWWWVPLPAILAFGAWYVAYGRDHPVTLPSIPVLVTYVVNGAGNAFGQVIGLGPEVGLIVAVLLSVAALANLVSGERLRLGLLGGLVGLYALFVVIGLARAAVQPESYPAGRFVDVAAVFCLIAIIGWLGHRRLGRAGEGHRIVLAVVVIGGVALAWNLGRAFAEDDQWRARAQSARAAYTLMEEYGGSPAIPADRGFGYDGGWLVVPAGPGEREWLPSPARFAELVERYGSPRQDPLAPWRVDTPDRILDDLFAQLMAPSLTIGPGTMSGESFPLAIEATSDVITKEAGACQILEVTGPEPRADMVVPSGSSLALMSDVGGMGTVSLSLTGTFRRAGVPVELVAGSVMAVGIPDIGVDKTMRLRLVPPAEGLTMVCQAPGVDHVGAGRE